MPGFPVCAERVAYPGKVGIEMRICDMTHEIIQGSGEEEEEGFQRIGSSIIRRDEEGSRRVRRGKELLSQG